MARVSQTHKAQAARNAVAGLRKRFPSRRKILIDGKEYTTEEVVAVFQRQIDALEAIRTARAQLAMAVANERKIAASVSRMVPSLRTTLTALFGLHAAVLADFGWSLPGKPGPKTVAAKAEGALKVKATREARHTLGKRQKQKIRGTLPE